MTVPKVGKRHFPYTPAGERAAESARKAKRNKPGKPGKRGNK